MSKVPRTCMFACYKKYEKTSENSFVLGLLCSHAIIFFLCNPIYNSFRPIATLPAIIEQSDSRRFKITENPLNKFHNFQSVPFHPSSPSPQPTVHSKSNPNPNFHSDPSSLLLPLQIEENLHRMIIIYNNSQQ